MRGTLVSSKYDGGTRGIIPAYAGNTRGAFRPPVAVWDHPRVCGEHISRRGLRRTRRGSSPRMRGTLDFHPEGKLVTGIIPAYAGNTENASQYSPVAWDHPRVCGEHVCDVCHEVGVKGSSPRMRGTPCGCVVCFPAPGIIPAYAGNTGCTPSAAPATSDHPRVCGEHPYAFGNGDRFTGSSPRMRGTPRLRGRGVGLCGIIPAYAGNTGEKTGDHVAHRDHPRVCGEHTYESTASDIMKGSSPRMRGTHRTVRS